MNTCTKRGCNNRRFMESKRCFDHQTMDTPLGFKIWFAFAAILSLGMAGLFVWVAYALVQWVTSK